LRVAVGGLVSYGDLRDRRRLSRGHSRHGTAVGANPVAFLIPCHRG